VEATGESTDVRPSKILSGKEPEKTNNLLQIIARGIRLENEAGNGKPIQKNELEQAEKNKKSRMRPDSKSKSIRTKVKKPDIIPKNDHKPPSIPPTSTIANPNREKAKIRTRSQAKTSDKSASRKSGADHNANKQQVLEKKLSEKPSRAKINALKGTKSKKSISVKSKNKDKTKVEKNARRGDQSQNDHENKPRVPPRSAILDPPSSSSAKNSNRPLRYHRKYYPTDYHAVTLSDSIFHLSS